jgi:glutathione S-transferase
VVDAVPWRFTDKESSGHKAVPVLVRDGASVADSWAIAEWVEAEYPNLPSLFPADGPKELAKFVNVWADTTLLPLVAKLIVADLHGIIAEKDKDYFRQSREARFGTSLETVCTDRSAALDALRRGLAPARAMLRDKPYLSGDAPGYADYCLFGIAMWALCSTGLDLSEGQEPLTGWMNRLLAAHEGFAASAKRAA